MIEIYTDCGHYLKSFQSSTKEITIFLKLKLKNCLCLKLNIIPHRTLFHSYITLFITVKNHIHEPCQIFSTSKSYCFFSQSFNMNTTTTKNKSWINYSNGSSKLKKIGFLVHLSRFLCRCFCSLSLFSSVLFFSISNFLFDGLFFCIL